MPQLLKEKMVKARKAHNCQTCLTVTIQPGTVYRRATYVYDGMVYDWVSCEPCEAISMLVYDWWSDSGEEGVGFDEYRDWAYEHEDDPEHGEAARAYLQRLNLHKAASSHT